MTAKLETLLKVLKDLEHKALTALEDCKTLADLQAWHKQYIG